VVILARGRSPNRDKAFDVYKKHKGKIKNKDIAEMLHEDPKTVSKWKTLDKWEERLSNSKKEKGNSKFEKTNNTAENEVLKGEVFDDLNEIVENVDLNEKQILFCIYFIKSFNAAKAYQKAYGCDLVSAYTAGSRLLKNVHINMAIEKMKQNRFSQAMLRPEDIVQKYIDIAHSDITDYITFGKKQVLTGFTKEKVAIYENINYVDYKESIDIDGTLITEFKEGKNGFSIKLMNREKALQWLSDHMDMATEEQKARIDHLRNKVKVDNETLEIKKKQAEKDDW
jgi:phage terminase small subunit